MQRHFDIREINFGALSGLLIAASLLYSRALYNPRRIPRKY
jgi:hypothetical protein